MNIRHSQILEVLRRDGRVSVEDLSQRFGMTLQTIRRDLTDLAEAGRVERVHGGAVLPSGTTNIAYGERRALNADAKARIARACAAQIPDDCAIFLGIGTTTEAVAQELTAHRNLLVVTNNMTIATILTANPECQIIVTGGALRRSDGGLVGPVAVASLRAFKVDIAIIGCSALDGDGDLLDFDLAEVEVSRAALAQARAGWLVADRAKFSRTAPARIVAMTELTAVFTDAALPAPLALACAQAGVAVHAADP